MSPGGIRVAVAVLALGVSAPSAAGATAGRAPASGARALSTRVTPRHVRSGGVVGVSGSVRDGAVAVAGELLELQLASAPHGRFVNVAHTVTAADGHYSFAGVRIYRATRVRVADVAARVRGAAVEVDVPPVLYPAPARVRGAARWLGARAGVTAFAVLDDHGRLSGANVHRRFHSASVVKSMLLVAYLRMLQQSHRALDDAGRALLYPMIHSSDNGAASAVLGAVGEGALDRVARDAHMRDYEPGGATWGFTEISAADLARFFYVQDSLIPHRFDGYARWLLSGIEAGESWGIPAVARPQFSVFFKGGWLPEVEGLVNQAGRLERPGITFALAVLSTHDPSMAYGEQTIEGVTRLLLGRAG